MLEKLVALSVVGALVLSVGAMLAPEAIPPGPEPQPPPASDPAAPHDAQVPQPGLPPPAPHPEPPPHKHRGKDKRGHDDRHDD